MNITRDREVYFAFINLFLCLWTKTMHSHCNLTLYIKFWKIIKFSKYGALTYYKPNDPKFSSVSLYLFPRLIFFYKILNFGKYFLFLFLTVTEIAFLLWSLTTNVIPKFRSISYSFWVLDFKNFNFKIDFFLKCPPFGHFWYDFYQKLISAS